MPIHTVPGHSNYAKMLHVAGWVQWTLSYLDFCFRGHRWLILGTEEHLETKTFTISDSLTGHRGRCIKGQSGNKRICQKHTLGTLKSLGEIKAQLLVLEGAAHSRLCDEVIMTLTESDGNDLNDEGLRKGNTEWKWPSQTSFYSTWWGQEIPQWKEKKKP